MPWGRPRRLALCSLLFLCHVCAGAAQSGGQGETRGRDRTLLAYACAPASAIEDSCSQGHGSCCEAANGEAWMDVFRRRSGLEDAVIHKVATAHPLAHMFGDIESLVGGPLSPEVLKGEAHTIWARLHIFRIAEVDEKHQQFKMHYKLTWLWRDCRLLSDCAEMVVNDRHADFRKFWTPNYRIQELESDDEVMKASSHIITGHGWDAYTEEHMSSFRCALDFHDLPYDIHMCSLTLLLPDMPDSKFQLGWRPITSDVLQELEWNIDQGEDWQTFVRTVPGFHPVWVNRPQNSSQLVTTFRLKRESHTLLSTYVFTCTLNYFLSLCGTLLDPAAVPARATYGVLTILVQSHLRDSLREHLPPIGYSTRLGVFLTMTFTLICIHTLVYGLMHFATRWLKVLKSRVVPFDSENPASAEGWWEKTKLVLLTYVALHIERHTRWLSPLAWSLGTIILLA